MLVNSMLCHPAAISRFCKDVGFDEDFTLRIQRWHFTKGNSQPSFMWNLVLLEKSGFCFALILYSGVNDS